MTPGPVARAERLLGREAQSWASVERRGYSVNEHWTVGFADGSRAFVKEAHLAAHPEWLRQEYRVYQAVSGPFMPECLAFEDGDRPLLVLEELMPAHWPPPWRPGDVDAVRSALREVAAAEVRGELPRVADAGWPGWSDVAADPEPFLGLGLVPADWLDRHLQTLVDAEESAPVGGDALIHADVRSDNLCIRDGRAVLVDWNHARIGNADLDVAFWLPSLRLESGPPPHHFGVDGLAVVVSGFFAAHAGLPPPAGAPTVRGFQRAQLEIALPWTCAALGLPLQ